MFDTTIPSIKSYNLEMRKGIIDKAFFIDKIDCNVIVDFGCADGALFQYIHNIFPEMKLFGYDISEKMIELAKANCPYATITSNWNLLIMALKKIKGKKAIVCNSLIHEVYAYGETKSVSEFWDKIFASEIFDFVVIRDMIPPQEINRISDRMDVFNVRKNAEPNHLADFEKRWGTIENNKNLTHFLLKYRYTENWEREVKENYLPITLFDLFEVTPKNWTTLYFDHNPLPFIKEKVKKDFDIDFREKTHLKLILEKRNI